MSVHIKVGFFRRTTRPAVWSDVVTQFLWMVLAIVCAYPLMPTIAERTAMSDQTGVLFTITFAFIALLHAYDAVKIARGLHKQKATA